MKKSKEKKMKKLFNIFKHDIKNVSKNMIIFVVIIGITILPALYAWFNIASNWDPYSNTGELPFAVCSKDTGYQYKTVKINAGDSIVDGLKGKPQMKWDFVSEEEAKRGVKDGKYYAAVIIPEDFSENLLSIVSGNFKQAKLQYYANEKKNAIATKITDKGVQAIEESIGTEYVDTLGKTLGTALGLASDEITNKKGELADKVVSDLKDTKKDIKTFKSSVNVLMDTLDSIEDLVQSNKELMPTVKKSLSKAGVFNEDVKSILTATKGTASDITASLEGIMSAGGTYMTNVADKADEAFGYSDNDPLKAADKLERIKVTNQKIISVNNKVISILENMQSNLGVNCSKAIKKLQAANKKQEAIISVIDAAVKKIRSTGKVPENVQTQVKQAIADADQALAKAESSYLQLKPKIDKLVNKAFSVFDDVSDFINVLKAGPEQIDNVLDSALDTTANLKKALKDLKTFLTTVDKRIDKVIVKVKDVKGDNVIENIILPIVKDPNALGKFVSSPVSYDTHRVYPIKNYGSAMAPFYSTLAIWVGALVLVAVLNVQVSRKEKEQLDNPNTTQCFFGRYLAFFIIGQLQALIIALGDLFFLKIQSDSPILFILTCMLSSFVYTMLIYSLTVTFSVIGKAIAVIIMVLQVAGSGGTFPIEVLPGPFRAMAPFLPFKYSVDALRETVAGVNTAHYLQQIGIFALFILVGLFIGLVLRKPCLKIISFFNNKIEESDLII